MTKMQMITTAVLWASLTAGNFIFQLGTRHEWGIAAERSYFQAIAMLMLALVLWLYPDP